jgi:multiple antibiotic resistance protein
MTSAYARRRFQRLVVPFAMPLLIGPGAISHHHHLQASEAEAVRARRPGGGGRPSSPRSGVVTIALLLADRPVISRLLGEIGLTIIVRVLGLILCAMAMQFIIVGVSDVARGGIIKSDVLAPYAAEK